MLKHSMTVACALLAIALVPAAASAAAPGLGGVQFSESDPTITVCAAGEGGGTITYEASGTATGSYAGPYTETGTVTVGAAEGPTLRQRVNAASIQFTINSPTGQVTGTKQYVPTGDPNVNVANGRCDWDGIGGSIFIASDDLRYNATIATPDDQTCTQSGGVSLSLVDHSSTLNDSFGVLFLNDISAPAPVCTGGEPEPEPEPEMPASKDDCQNGGWANYGFKNQGECIAWVNHNLP